MNTRQEHWEQVYRTRAPDQLSWYQPAARLSLGFIQRAAPDRAASIIDVGGGASTLVDGLIEAGYCRITILDLAPDALATSQARLGERGRSVRWIAGDVLNAELPEAAYDVWHDRAAFHFLADQANRVQYVAQVKRAVRPGGHLIMATFAPDGPPRCSGLDVVRYSAQSLAEELGEGFALVDTVRDDHRTPSGAIQRFQYSLLRMGG